jgi:hypothetical protein
MRKDDTGHIDTQRTCSRHEQLQRRKGAAIVYSGIQLTSEEAAGVCSHLLYHSHTADSTIKIRTQWVPEFFAGSKATGASLNTHFQLVLRLRMSGDIPLLPLHAFMTWTGKNLPLSLF